MVRNSAALMTGDDPSSAEIAFVYRQGEDDTPGSYFPQRNEAWFWPADGLYLDGGLSVLLQRIVAAPEAALGFAIDGFVLVRSNPGAEGDPLAWQWEDVEIGGDDPAHFLGVTLLAHGDHVYLFGVQESAKHAVVLARYPTGRFRAGALSEPEYWGGPSRGWNAEVMAPVIDEGATEFSVDPMPNGQGFALVYSRGFGATTVAWRTAPALTGPYGAPQDLYAPPESTVDRPFVYAGKAHGHLRGADLVATYAANSFDFGTLLDDPTLYFPRFVRIELP